jgi:hypothetical protein
VGDCDDTDATVNTAATEIAGDGVDQDGDSVELCFVDADGDGYTTDGRATVESADLLCDGAGRRGRSRCRSRRGCRCRALDRGCSWP